MANGDPTKVKVGAGKLRFGPPNPGTEPTSYNDVPDPTFTMVGYTDAGHDATLTPKFDAIEVAEELMPLRYEETSREMTVEFDAAEMTAENVAKVLNGGTIVTTTGLKTYEPPDVGSVTRVSILWDSLDGQERWLYRQCVQTGAAKISRKKAPDKATIPFSFNVEIPTSGAKPFKAWFAA
jgi:hypothetical protein